MAFDSHRVTLKGTALPLIGGKWCLLLVGLRAVITAQMWWEHFPKMKRRGQRHDTLRKWQGQGIPSRPEHLAANTQQSLGKPQLTPDVQHVAFLSLSQCTFFFPPGGHYRVHLHAAVKWETLFPSNPWELQAGCIVGELKVSQPVTGSLLCLAYNFIICWVISDSVPMSQNLLRSKGTSLLQNRLPPID